MDRYRDIFMYCAFNPQPTDMHVCAWTQVDNPTGLLDMMLPHLLEGGRGAPGAGSVGPPSAGAIAPLSSSTAGCQD